MKKIIIFILLIIPSFVYAKDITIYERTYDDLRIDSSYDLDSVDYQKIMNTPSVDETQKVYDFADILTDSEEDNLVSFINPYIEAYKSDYVIVTINSNTKCNYETSNNCSLEYADNFYKYNFFNKDGVLVLIDLKNKNDCLNIYTNGNTSSIFNEKTINSIIEYSYNYFNENDYFEGLKDIIYTMSSYYKKDLSYYSETKVTTNKDKNKYFVCFIISFFISLISGLIFITVHYSRSVKDELIDENDYYTKSNGINRVNDILVNEHEIITDIDPFDDYDIKGDIF